MYANRIHGVIIALLMIVMVIKIARSGRCSAARIIRIIRMGEVKLWLTSSSRGVISPF
jgi:hypothetical protein